MQKLQGKFKNTPKDASQVPCSVNFQLNRDESLSAENKVLTCNNPEGNLVQHTGRSLKAIVYVLNKEGKPLMPCSFAKSKRLVKKGGANVVKRFPFTIQINFECKEEIQSVILGIDPGYQNVGISARTTKKELIRVEVQLRTDINKKLTEKRMYRKNRRNKLWYRQPRWSNRVATKKQGWLAPSVQHKLDSHIRLVKRICKLLPVSKIIVEVANFDIQKINNPDISGVEYQQGSLLGYENSKSYLIAREGKCQLCNKESTKGNPFKIHHIIQRKDGGTNSPSNLALLHKKCHDKLHEQGLKLKASKQFKAETFMSTVRWKIVEELKNLPTSITFGYITKVKRQESNIEKSHSNDAFIISEGKDQERAVCLNIKQKRKNNRCLQLNRKGFQPSIRKQRYPIQPNDLVKINGKIALSGGVHCKGKRIIVNGKSVNISLLDKWKFNFGSFMGAAIPPTSKDVGFLAANL